MLNKKALSAAFGVEKDANFKQTVLLLHGDGTNGAQNNTFLDSSTNNFTITRNGNTTQGTFSPFSVAAGEWSNYFDGTGDYLSFANGTFNLGSNDFVIESFFYVTSSGGYYTIAGGNTDLATQTGSSWNVTINNTGTISGTAYSGSTLYQITTTATVSQNVWNHVVFVRTGGTISLFLNGTKDGTNTTLSTASINNGSTTYPPCVGANGTANVFIGYLSNTRIIIGSNSSNVYSASASSITVPTAPLTAVTDTKVLTCRSNRFVDISSSPNTVTPNGNTSVQPFSPFAPSAVYSASTNGGSGYFNSTTDQLRIADSTAFDLANDFTIEFWVYPTAVANNPYFVCLGDSAATNNGFLIYYSNSTSSLRFYVNGAAVLIGSSLSNNQWYHVAVVRSGSSTNNLKMYLNGVQDAQATNTVSYTGVAGNGFVIGAEYNASTFGGNGFFYMSNCRLVKGTAVYTGAFTPPTAPLTAITNTSLLCNFTNAAIFDQTGKNNLETVGNAQIDTGTKKFGTGSLEFDGTGDSLLLRATPDLLFGTGDFTVEGWFYQTADNTYPSVLEIGDHVSSTGIIFITKYAGNATIYSGGFYGSKATTLNTWNHIAWVRSSGTLKIYVNGVGSTGVSFTNNLTSTTSNPVIGSTKVTTETNYLYTGYIDDLRITKGVARYTADFTPPAKAFADL